MGESSVKKYISEKLPQIISIPHIIGIKDKKIVVSARCQQLKEKDNPHDDHQIFNDWRQAIPKRETVPVIGHFCPS